MAEPTYIPVLPTGRSALTAYRDLAPSARAAIAPLWTVPPPDPARPRRPLGDLLATVAHHQGAGPAWWDAAGRENGPETSGGTGGDDPPAVVSALRDVLPGTPLRPVTGVERPVWQQTACVEAALTCGDGRGMGIRVVPAPPGHGRLADRLQDLLARIGLLARSAPTGLPLDLLIDLDAVQDDHTFRLAEKRALDALARLGPLHPWRTVSVLAGSCPGTEGAPDGYGAPFAEAERYDWDLWHLAARSPDGRRLPLVHGDYAAAHPRGVRQPRVIPDGPPWGLLRLTGERTYLLGRVPACGADHHTAVRAMARELVATEDFDAAPDSEPKRWLRACAEGQGPRGAGGPEAWARAAHGQHLAYVVRRLRGWPPDDWAV
ncbi:hypothetical protein AB0C52_15515 [Streptomyces sp. NPDC048717]|uniref:beta family protein n=1 Tax=Streptomyces sp. NPDC048717 TaxID=3154928 RepID=UPI003420132F